MAALRFALTLAAFGLLRFSPVAADDLKNENILVSPPEGYRIGFEERKDNERITRMIPSSETMENWTEMLTIQVFRGKNGVAPETFEANAARLWAEKCLRAEKFHIADGIENGYAFRFWMLSCSSNKDSGGPEVAWFKAIQGNDAVYVARRTARFTPNRDQTIAWIRHMKNIRVCDTRLPARPCS
jgi:hypothetical protein